MVPEIIVTVVTIVAFVASMIAFSYAFMPRNRLFIIPEAIFIGGTTAHSIFQIYSGLKGTCFDFIAAGQVWLIIPLIIGLLAYARLTRFRWLARYPVAILSGAGAGVLLGLVGEAQFVNPVRGTVEAVLNVKLDPFSRIVSIAMFIPMVILFLYSRKLADYFHVPDRPLYYLQRLARVGLLMTAAFQMKGQIFPSIPILFQNVVKPVTDMLMRALGFG